MSHCIISIGSLIDSGLSSKNMDVFRANLMNLHYLFQEEVKMISSTDYKALADLLSNKLANSFQSQSFSDRTKALHITLCLICCGGALFNDLKANFQYWLLSLVEDQNIDNNLSELLALVMSHYVAAFGPVSSEKVDKIVFELQMRVQVEKSDHKRITAIRCLREIGSKAPSCLYRYMDDCVKWALPLFQDTKASVRSEACKFLRSIIWAINSREFRSQQPAGGVSAAKRYYDEILELVTVDFRKTGFSSIFNKSYSTKEEIVHGSLLILHEFFRAAVICTTKSPEQLQILIDAEDMNAQEEEFKYSYSELHAIRRRRISGSLLSQIVTPLTMLQKKPLIKFRLPFSCIPTLQNAFKPLLNNLLNFLRAGRNSILVIVCLHLIPWLANFNPQVFKESSQMNQLIDEIISLSKREKLACLPLVTLSLLCNTMPDTMIPHGIQIMKVIQTELYLRDSNRKWAASGNALFFSIGILAASFKEQISAEIRQALEPMFKFGLSVSLIDCLENVVENVSSLRQDVRTVLHGHIAFIVAQHSPDAKPGFIIPTHHGILSHSIFGSTYNPLDVQSVESGKSALLLALQTLERFNFDGYHMIGTLDVLCEKLIGIENKFIRILALRAICKILLPFTKCMSFCNIHGPPTKDYTMVATYVGFVIRSAVCDPDPDVRYAAISVLDDTPELNFFIAQPENLNILLYAVNDEIFEIREVAISLTGQLSNINPACVLSSLRKFLLELVYQLNTSTSMVRREQSVHSISALVSSAPRLMSPFMHAMMEVLMSAISSDVNCPLNVPAIQAIGEYAQISSGEIISWVEKISSVLLNMLSSRSNSECKEVALWTMTRIIQGGGYVSRLQTDYLQLVPTLLDLMDTDPSKFVHREVLRLLGTMGTRRRLLQTRAIQDDPRSVVGEKDEPKSELIRSRTGSESTITKLSSSEHLYGTIVLNELLSILQDRSIKYLHDRSIDAICEVLAFMEDDISLSMRNLVIKDLLFIIRASVGSTDMPIAVDRLTGLILQFGLAKVDDSILAEISDLLQYLWKSDRTASVSLLKLANSVVYSTGINFEPYANSILPLLLDHIKPQNLITEFDEIVLSEVFSLLIILSPFLSHHMQVIVPYITDVFTDETLSISVRKSAIATLSQLVSLVDVRRLASGMIVPLMRVGSTDVHIKPAVRDCIVILGKRMGRDFGIFKQQLSKAFPDDLIIENLIYDCTHIIQSIPMLQAKQSVIRRTATKHSRGTPERQSSRTESSFRSQGIHEPASINPQHITKYCAMAYDLCKEDVSNWFQAFRLSFVTQSPSPSIVACKSRLLDGHGSIVGKLFNISFMSCWALLRTSDREKLISGISHVLKNFDDLEFGHSILALVEFFDRQSTIGYLPFDLDLLCKKSIQLRAYASALHYAELQFRNKKNDTELIETLISVNNELDQLDSAHGALTYARQQNMRIRELWYEKLGHWSRALRNYEFRQSNDLNNEEIILGRMRCLEALGEWSQLNELCFEQLNANNLKMETKQHIANIAVPCAWALRSWEFMSTMVNDYVDKDTVEARIYSCVLLLRERRYSDVQKVLKDAWNDLHQTYTSLFARDYRHINNIIAQAQSLIEIEEVIQYSLIEYRRPVIRNLWRTRLNKWCDKEFETWYRSLLIYSLVIPPIENEHQWVSLVDICNQSGKDKQANHIFAYLLNINRKEPIMVEDIPLDAQYTYFAFLKQKRAIEIKNSSQLTSGDKDWQGFRAFVESLPDAYASQPSLGIYDSPMQQMETEERVKYWQHFKAECYHTLAERTLEVNGLSGSIISKVQKWYEQTLKYQSDWREAWVDLANFHYKVVREMSRSAKLHTGPQLQQHEILITHVNQCLKALYKSISLGTSIEAFQNTLRFLTLWFQFGNDTTVLRCLSELLSYLPVEPWLQVIPQLISRIDNKQINVAKLVQQLLVSIGRKHPQALIYSLAVASKSDDLSRRDAATNVLVSMRQHSENLVQQALLISEELIRISILWHEHWYEQLNEASRLNISEHDVKGCMDILIPMHEQLIGGGETIAEKAFVDAFGLELNRAYEHWKRFQQTRDHVEVTSAWQIYYKVFSAIKDKLNKTTTFDLKYVSPKLLGCTDVELAIPGTYEASESPSPIISIQKVESQIVVIPSKQRPRKLSMLGSDGKRYLFLLKGHEDLRQDQRAMQLFVLINSLLERSAETRRHDLAIGRYSVVPLAPNNGLISWLHKCDTLRTNVDQYITKIAIKYCNPWLQHGLCATPYYENAVCNGHFR